MQSYKCKKTGGEQPSNHNCYYLVLGFQSKQMEDVGEPCSNMVSYMPNGFFNHRVHMLLGKRCFFIFML